jgi:hypothetical protein
MYYKICGGSEPTSYSVAYSGSGKSDASKAALFEITGPNATNPVDVKYAASTATNPTATASGAGEIGIILYSVENTIAQPSPPSGWTIQCQTAGTTNTYAVGIATQTGLGSGSVTPGAWTGTATYQRVWTVLVK